MNSPSGQKKDRANLDARLLSLSLVSGFVDERPGEGVRRQRVRDFQHPAGAAEVSKEVEELTCSPGPADVPQCLCGLPHQHHTLFNWWRVDS